jgi:hypothetical protein
MTMARPGAAGLSVLLLSGFVAAARADKVVELKQPVIGCAAKADLGHFPHPSAGDISQPEMPLPYRSGRCIRLARGPIRVERVEGTYTCVRASRHSCWWVRSEEIGMPIKNDSAF